MVGGGMGGFAYVLARMGLKVVLYMFRVAVGAERRARGGWVGAP